MKKTIKINGMMCGHCEKAVRKALEAIDGVVSAVADHTKDIAVVELDKEVLDQAIRYNMVLNVKYILITNGVKTYICRKGSERYEFIDYVPDYNEMIG